MNPRIFLPLIFLTVFQFHTHAQTALDSLAMDMCDCLKPYTESISNKGQRVLHDAAVFDDYDEIENAISDHFTFNSDDEDSNILERAMDDGYEICANIMGRKYRYFFESIEEEDEAEMLDLYFNKLTVDYDCGITKVISILVN